MKRDFGPFSVNYYPMRDKKRKKYNSEGCVYFIAQEIIWLNPEMIGAQMNLYTFIVMNYEMIKSDLFVKFKGLIFN